MINFVKVPGIRNALILAVLIRFLLMPFYFHPDIKTTSFKASFLREGVLDIYTYLDKNIDKLTLKENFNYFPLAYFTLGSYQILMSPFLGPDFPKWLSNASISAAEATGVYRFLFILKLPYLILDLGIAFLLTSFFTDIQKKKKAFIFWLFNPFSVVLIYIFSNIDIFPVFLMILSLYFAKKEKLVKSALMLGLGAGFKAFPILVLPFLIMLGKNVKDKIFISIAGIGSFLLIILPFLKSSSFHRSTLDSGLTTRIISSGLDIGFGEVLMPAIILLSFLFFWGISNKKIDLWRYYLVSFLLVLISIHFHIQWLLWIIPFFAILYVLGSGEEKSLSIFFLMIAFAIPLLYADKFMTVGLLKAISPLYELLPMPRVLLSKIYNPDVIQGVLHSILFGLGILLSFRVLNKK